MGRKKIETPQKKTSFVTGLGVQNFVIKKLGRAKIKGIIKHHLSEALSTIKSEYENTI